MKKPKIDLKLFFAYSIDLLCVASSDGFFHMLNPEWEKVLGYSITELEGKKFLDFVHPEDIIQTKKATDQLFKTNILQNFVNRYKKKDDSYVWLEWQAYLKDDLFYASARDISVRIRTEDELKKADHWLRESQRNSHIGSYNLNIETGSMQNSSELDSIFGISSNYNKSIDGWFNLIHPDDIHIVKGHLQLDVLKEHKTFNKKYRIIRQNDGEVRWVHELGNLYFDKDGNVIQMIGTIQDITLQKESKEELKVNEQLFRSIFENSSIAIAQVSLDGNFLMVNNALCKLLGYSKLELLNLDFYKFTHPSDIELSKTSIEDGLKGKKKTVNFLKRYIHKTGKIIWADVSSQLIYDNNKKPIYFLTHINDITDRKQAENELLKSEQKYRLLFENMTSGFALHEMIYDENGNPSDYRYLEANPAFEKLTGLSIKEIIGKSIKEIVPNMEEYWVQTFGNVAISGEPLSYMNFVSAFGKYYETYVFSPEKGKFAVVFNDSTDRVKAENELRLSEQKFSSLYNLSPDMLGISRISDGKIMDGNMTMTTLTGYTREEFLGRTTLELGLWANPEDRNTSLSELKEKGEIKNFEILMRIKDGSILTCFFSAKTITYNNESCLLFVVNDITEQKNIEKSLKESESRLRSFIDESSEGVVILNESGIIEEWNKTAEIITGITKQEAENKYWWDVAMMSYSPDKRNNEVREYIEKIVKDLLETGKSDMLSSKIFPIQQPTGEIKYLEQTLFAIKTESGYRIAGIFNDITNRIKTEEALQQSRTFTDALLSSIPGLVYMYNEEGYLVRWNKKHETVTGYSSEELSRKHIYDWYFESESDLKAIKEGLESVSLNGFGSTEAYLQKKNGEKILYYFSAVSTNIDGKNYFTGIGIDITERKKVEDDLANTVETLKTVIETVPVALFDVDTKGIVKSFWNPAAEELLGWTKEEAIGNLLPTITLENRAEFEQTLNKVNKGQTVKGIDVDRKKKNGEDISYSLYATPLYNRNGIIIGNLAALVDITKRKQYEEALKKHVLALTQPLGELKDIQFTDLFNIDELQKIQDTFAEATNVASIITYPDGTPITKSSNFCKLCNLIRTTEKGQINCFKSDAFLGKQNSKGATIQPCLSGGLWDAGASITLGGVHLANWLIGQVRNETQNEQEILKYADEIGLNQEQFKQALDEVPAMTIEQFEKVSKYLFILANEISLKAYLNIQQARFITEQKQAEKDLRKSEEQFRGITQNIPGVVFQFYSHASGEIGLSYVSELSQKYLGLDSSDLSGFLDGFIAGLDETDKPTFNLSIENAIKNQSSWVYEGKYRKPDGEQLYFRGISQPRILENDLVFDGIILDISESILAAKELDETRAMLTTAFMQTPIPMVIVSAPDYIVRLSNSAAIEMLGIQDEISYTGRSLLKIKPSWQDFDEYGIEVPITEMPITLALRGINTKNKEYCVKRKDGTIRWESVSASAIRSSSGEIISAYLVFPDITEQKIAEDSLLKSQKLLSESQRIAGIGCWELQLRENTLNWNENTYEMFGFKMDEFKPTFESFVEIVHADDRLMVNKHLEEAFSTKTFRDFECRIVRPDKEIITVLIVGAVSSDEKGIPFRTFGIVQDITERKKTEEKLINFAHEMEWLMKSMVNAFVMWQTEFDENNKLIALRFAYFNEAYERMVGNKLEDIRGKEIREIWPDVEENWFEIYSEIALTGNAKSFELFFKPTKGLYSCNAYRPWNSTDRICVVFDDITERKKAEEKFKQLAGLHQTILDTLTVGLIYVKDRKIQWTNKDFSKMFGLDHLDTFGMSTEFLYKDEKEYERVGIEAFETLIKGEAYSHEAEARKADGSSIWIYMVGKAIFLENPVEGSIWMVQNITSRKDTELALKKSESILKATIESMNDGVLVVSSDGIVTHSNTRFSQFFNIPNKLLALKADDILLNFVKQQFVNPDEFAKQVMDIYKSDSPTEDILNLLDERIMERLSFPLLESSPLEGRVWFFRDITERKKAEEILQETRTRLQTFMDSATDSFTIWDKNLNLVLLNKTALSYLTSGLSNDEVIGMNLLEFLPYLKNDHEYDKYLEVLKTGIPYSGIDHFKLNNADERWIISRIFKVGQGLGFVTSDITEQKKAEAVLIEKDAKLRSIFLAAPVAIGLTNNRIFLECNETFFKMTGYSPEEIIGKTAQFIYPTDEEFELIGHLQNTNMKEQSKDNIESRWLRKNGEIINILLQFVPLDSSDFSKGITFTALDITERLKTEKEIAELNRELERKVEERTEKLNLANKELESFSYSVSHDLRAPIRHIDGFVRLLYSNINNPGETIQNYFQKINAASSRMSGMIDDLLSFSRLGRKELTFFTINTNSLIKEIIEQSILDIEKHSIEWIISELPEIYGDRNLLKLAFENLISNSIKYSSKNKSAIIEIGSNQLPNFIEFYVKDNGVGFDMNYVDKLFGVFQRLHSNEEFEGTGIGLANVKQIINKHGGTVRAEGKVNSGATFYILLPK